MTLFNSAEYPPPSPPLHARVIVSFWFFPPPFPYQSLTHVSPAGTAVSPFGFLFPFSQEAYGRGDEQTTNVRVNPH